MVNIRKKFNNLFGNALSGLAYFAEKPLFANVLIRSPLQDALNIDVAHEHIIFDHPTVIQGYNNNQPVTNIGFGPDGRFSYNLTNLEQRRDFNQLKRTSGKYDDAILAEAIGNVPLVPYWGLPSQGGPVNAPIYYLDNCQSWAERVRQEYERIQKERDQAKTSTAVVSAIDPNDIIGPVGSGTQGWLASGQVLPYTIRFENESTATAPAEQVTITEQLDPNLNWNTFELGDFGFGSIYVNIPKGAHLRVGGEEGR